MLQHLIAKLLPLSCLLLPYCHIASILPHRQIARSFQNIGLYLAFCDSRLYNFLSLASCWILCCQDVTIIEIFAKCKPFICCHVAILQSCHVAMLPYCCVAMLPYCRVAKLLKLLLGCDPHWDHCKMSTFILTSVATLQFCHVAILPCCHVAIMPCCHVAMLPYCHVAMLPYCSVAMLPCCHIAALPSC